jgi:amino acid adenylation domain-containing protein
VSGGASESVFPASYAQRRLWFIQQLSPASAAYNMVITMPVPREISTSHLQGALDAVVARHEVLRTRFSMLDGDVMQHVASSGRIVLLEQSCGSGGEQDRLVSDRVAPPFDLSKGPLARALLCRLPQGEAGLTLVVHHIIADAQTLKLVLTDISAALWAISQGRAPTLPEAPIDYADYAVWQRRSLTGPRLQALTDYWHSRLQGLSDLKLFHDNARPASGSTRGGAVPLTIDAAVSARLRALGASRRTSLFAVLLAGFTALLARVTGEVDIPLGLPVSGRSRQELERVAGLFINSVVFRAFVDPVMSFEAYVDATSTRLAQDLSNQELPFELLVETLRVPRRTNSNPLFQVMLQLQVDESHRPREGAGQGPQLAADKLTSQLDLSMILVDHGTGPIEGALVYSVDLFEHATVQSWARAFAVLVEAAAALPATAIADLPLLDKEDGAAIRRLIEGPRRARAETPLAAWFQAVARTTPQNTALEHGDKRLTYAALEERAAAIAHDLSALRAAPGSVVVIELARSIELVCALLGASMTGAAYLLLDPTLPVSRRAFIVANCGATIIVESAKEAPGSLAYRVVEGAADAAVPPSAAYLIYTSGSTGEPKGVVISQQAAVNHMRWMIDRFGFDRNERVLQRTAITFDASVWEVWAPLLCGGTLVLLPDEGPFDPEQLLRWVDALKVTVLQLVPSMLRALLTRPKTAEPQSLRHLFCGGEALSADLAQRARKTFGLDIVNLYGPSETTVDATFHVCTPADDSLSDVPIGRPIDNASAYVLDKACNPLPLGTCGELYIGGDAVGLGYCGNKPLTDAQFVPNPHGEGRLYRTGDRAIVDGGGRLRFVGRVDDQVKLRGHRIELQEIEARLLSHPAVAEAVAVVQEHGPMDHRLVAFVLPGGNCTPEELIRWLETRLPAYSVPGLIELRPTLPTTAHGKLDRNLLARLRTEPKGTRTDRHHARTPRQVLICSAFARSLGREEVDLDDDMFELGGHSLMAVMLSLSLSDVLEVPVSVLDIFEHPTPRRLEAAIGERMGKGSEAGSLSVKNRQKVGEL